MSQGRKAFGPSKKRKSDLTHFVKSHNKVKKEKIEVGESGPHKTLEQKLKKPRRPN